MAKKRPFVNPFYALLLVVGVAFLLTATSYGVMAFRDVRGHGPAESGPGLMLLLDRHGGGLLAAELALLVLASFAAMATDKYWTKAAAPGTTGPETADRKADEREPDDDGHAP